MYRSIVFSGGICLVCSILLAIASSTLKPYQDYNVSIDQKKNVLKALGYLKDFTMLGDHVEDLYNEHIKEVVIDLTGRYQKNKTIADAKKSSQLLYLYETKDASAIAIPVEGMGLWSLLQGYLALEKNGHTIKGITFYEQKETPGLGAEIVKDWFTNNFKGKDLLNSQGKWVSVTVTKGKASNFKGAEPSNKVDGISGATITCRGVTSLLYVGMEAYKPYFSKMARN